MAITEESIKAVTEQMFKEPVPVGVEREDVNEKIENVDIYQQDVNERKAEMSKSIPHGASTLTNKIAEEAIVDLAAAKKRAEVDSDYWRERGDKDRAEMVKQQYMEEKFLPAVEMVIIASTPDEVLNAKDILSKFDEQTFEVGPGYTASYIRAAYQDQLGNASTRSDGYVRNQLERIKELVGQDQIRSAYGLAKKLKDSIDNGEHIADDTDYEIILRVANIK